MNPFLMIKYNYRSSVRFQMLLSFKNPLHSNLAKIADTGWILNHTNNLNMRYGRIEEFRKGLKDKQELNSRFN